MEGARGDALAGGMGAESRDMDLGAGAPVRPAPWIEHGSQWLYLALSPRLQARPQPEPPPQLGPYEILDLPREGHNVRVSATLYRAEGSPPKPIAGAVLLLPPWAPWGRAYFHRGGRLETLRRGGYHVLTLDLPGFGGTSPSPRRYFDHTVEAGLVYLEERYPDLPVHLWGVSAGGYWAHLLLSRREGVSGAFFEDVSPHLLEWSWRMAPWGLPAYAAFWSLFHPGYRYLDLRRHAPHLRVRAVTYVGGDRDRGIRPHETRTLARLAGGVSHIVAGAGHLEAIKKEPQGVTGRALATFAAACGSGGSGR